MDNNHILNHEIEWSKGGVQPAQNRAHHLYLDRMSKQVLEVLKREFSCHITEHVQQIDPTSKLYQEISQHVSLCQERYIICRLSKIVYLVLNCFKVYFPFYFYDTISISLLCYYRGRHFQGRRELLQTVKSYIRSKCRLPLILHGKAGCGKTALACKVALETQKWFKG